MQSTTQSFSAGHIDAVIRVYDETGNVIESDWTINLFDLKSDW
jgi:hypothetical protein